MSSDERGSEARKSVAPVRNVRSRRSVLKRMGTGALLLGAGALAGDAATRAFEPEVPGRTPFPSAGKARIDGVTIVDPLDGSRNSNLSVLLHDGRIESVMTVNSALVAADVRVIDGAGRFAVPGYNDMHSHVLQAPRPELALATMLAEGVTGFRQMEGSPEMLRNRAEQRLPLTPRAPGLLALPGDLLMPFTVSTAADARAVINEQWDQGADFVKFILTERDGFFGAVAAAHDRGLRIAGHLPPSVGVEEASDSGFVCVEHLGTGSNVWIACSREADRLWRSQDAGLPVPSWAVRLPFAGEVFTLLMKDFLTGPASNTTSEAQLALLARAFDTYDENKARELGERFQDNGTWQCPTLINLRGKYRADAPDYRTDPWLAAMPSGEREDHLANVDEFGALPERTLRTFHEYYDRARDLVGVWHKAGAPILAGTDGSGRGPVKSMRLEFQELGAAGLSPLEVLRSATTAPARYLDRQDRMGRIAAGMDADLVLLDADPLVAVDNLSSVSMVVRGGHTFTATELTGRVDELMSHGDSEAAAPPSSRPASCCS